jgi:hypothetical protein
MSNHPKRRSQINGQWSARLIEMLESPAYRVMSRAGHLIVSRVEIELGHHGGNDNGKLPVTVDQFADYGVHHDSIAPAIREAVALGFLRVERGYGGNADHRTPNRFYLTFAHGRDSRAAPPTHDWRRIKTEEEAKRIAGEARAAKDPRAIAHGKRSWKKTESRPRIPGLKPTPLSGVESANFPTPDSGVTGATPDSGVTSISGEGGARRSPRYRMADRRKRGDKSQRLARST